MSLDRINQSVVVSGTGPVALTTSAAPGGYRTFIAAMNPGDQATICIVDQVTYDWEVSTATFNAGNTLTRTATLASSASNLAVNFRGNNCSVFVTASAQVNPFVASLAALMASLPTTQPGDARAALDERGRAVYELTPILPGPSGAEPISGTPAGPNAAAPFIVRPLDFDPRGLLPAGLLLQRTNEAELVAAYVADGDTLDEAQAIAAVGQPLTYPACLPGPPWLYQL